MADQFTIERCIAVLNYIYLNFDLKEGQAITKQDLCLAISKTTGKMHPYFHNQFIQGMENIGCIKNGSKVVQILMGSKGLES